MLDIVIATRNRHKFRELKALLALPGIRWRSLADFPAVPSPAERGRTFDANATHKARSVAKATGLLTLADDSGLEVEALDGAPGVRSARFAGAHGDDRANNEKLLRALDGLPAMERRARYRCSLALARSGSSERRAGARPGVSEGRAGARPGSSERRAGAHPSRLIAITRGAWQGRIALTSRGQGGFGYDPIFLVPRLGKTVGELPASTKQRLSHRALAARRMRSTLRRLVVRRATAPTRAGFVGGRWGQGRTA